MEPSPPPPRPRRLRRVLTWVGASLGALILAVLFIVPPIVASTIRKQFIAAVRENLEATADVGSVSFSWTGNVSLRDVDIKDRDGAPLASVKSIDVHVGLLDALKGRYVADFRVDSPRLELRRGKDGRLNLATVAKPPKPENKPSGGAPVSIPDFDAKLDVRNAVLAIAGDKDKLELPLSGVYELKGRGGVVSLDGKNAIKDGSVTIAGEIDLRDPAPSLKLVSKSDLKIDRFPLDAQMSPLLELLHPAFSVASGQLSGTMDGSVAIHYDGALAAADDAMLNRITGDGRIEIRDCAISGSRLLGDLLGALQMEGREIRLKPMEFTIRDGRIAYKQPWQWTISGSETTFTGSIGLDRTLDLLWRVPVTDALASKLRVAKGQTYEIPIKGTVTRPRIDAKGVIRQVAEEKIEDAALKGLESLLGGKDEKKAEKLLQEADALHGEGKKADAAAKYRKIKDDYRKTRVYKDNKDRIDPRSEDK